MRGAPVSTPTAVGAIAAAIGLGGVTIAAATVYLGRAADLLRTLLAPIEDPDAHDDADHIYGGTTWHPRWDEEPRPGTGPRRDREVL